MRKFFVFAAAALVVLAACQKKGNEVENKVTDPSIIAMPAWVSDESLPVPLEMGTPALRTKGAPITDANTAGNFNHAEFTYTVLALKTVINGNDRVATTTVMPGFEGGVLARNVDGEADAAVNANPGGTGDDLTGRKVAQFGDFSGDGNTWKSKTLYYPYLYSAGTYNFYGYRVKDPAQNENPTLPELNVDGNSITTNVTLGSCDIIWAKAEPNSALESLTSNAYTAQRQADNPSNPAEVAKGFTAKYIRGARWAVAQGLQYESTPVVYTQFLPALKFEHITSQIQFIVKAYDQLAANTLVNANVVINSITLGDPATFFSTADLNIVDGSLTGHTNGSLSVVNIDPAFAITTQGASCGDPLFIMPCAATTQAPLPVAMSMSIRDAQNNVIQDIDITADVTAPAILENPNDATSTVLSPAGTFVKGYKYTFTISLMSLEKIKITTSLAEWIDANNTTDPIVID